MKSVLNINRACYRKCSGHVKLTTQHEVSNYSTVHNNVASPPPAAACLPGVTSPFPSNPQTQSSWLLAYPHGFSSFETVPPDSVISTKFKRLMNSSRTNKNSCEWFKSRYSGGMERTVLM